MRLLPCQTPPSVRLSAYEQTTGRLLFDQTVSQSQQISVGSFATLDVTMTQMDSALGLKVLVDSCLDGCMAWLPVNPPSLHTHEG